MTRIEIATRLYAAAISNTELVNQTAEQLRHASIAQADILLAECGEGEAAQPRKVEVTEVESLLSNLIVAINDYDELHRLYTLKDDHAFKDAERYIKGDDA